MALPFYIDLKKRAVYIFTTPPEKRGYTRQHGVKGVSCLRLMSY
jgi:hypothetical protein